LCLTGLIDLPLQTVAIIFALKSLASVISLGAGFRGGLFFASLLLGALGEQLFAALAAAWPDLHIDSNIYAIIGMSALAVSVIGGPLIMVFIALESTGDPLAHCRGADRCDRIGADDARIIRSTHLLHGAFIFVARPSPARQTSAGSAISRSGR
jgi:hypothetical protein